MDNIRKIDGDDGGNGCGSAQMNGGANGGCGNGAGATGAAGGANSAACANGGGGDASAAGAAGGAQMNGGAGGSQPAAHADGARPAAYSEPVQPAERAFYAESAFYSESARRAPHSEPASYSEPAQHAPQPEPAQAAAYSEQAQYSAQAAQAQAAQAPAQTAAYSEQAQASAQAAQAQTAPAAPPASAASAPATAASAPAATAAMAATAATAPASSAASAPAAPPAPFASPSREEWERSQREMQDREWQYQQQRYNRQPPEGRVEYIQQGYGAHPYSAPGASDGPGPGGEARPQWRQGGAGYAERGWEQRPAGGQAWQDPQRAGQWQAGAQSEPAQWHGEARREPGQPQPQYGRPQQPYEQTAQAAQAAREGGEQPAAPGGQWGAGRQPRQWDGYYGQRWQEEAGRPREAGQEQGWAQQRQDAEWQWRAQQAPPYAQAGQAGQAGQSGQTAQAAEGQPDGSGKRGRRAARAKDDGGQPKKRARSIRAVAGITAAAVLVAALLFSGGYFIGNRYKLPGLSATGLAAAGAAGATGATTAPSGSAAQSSAAQAGAASPALSASAGAGAGDAGGDAQAAAAQGSANAAPAGGQAAATGLSSLALNAPLGNDLTVTQIYQKVYPSIVGVKITFQSQGYSFGGFVLPNQEESGEGSGIIIRSDGYVMTNYHVVSYAIDSRTKKQADGAKIEVIMPDGANTAYTAELVGYDSSTDLAVLKVGKTGLPAAELGNSDMLVVGEGAVAIGNPGGMEYMSSVTVGVISGLNRTIQTEGYRNIQLIQTDAAINPGNSGGALINSKGQVIGVNSIKIAASAYEGLGFAIPINTAVAICDDLINYTYVTGRPYIGITAYSAYTEQMANQYRMPNGVYVYEIDETGPASEAGIQSNDIIVKFNGAEIQNFDALETEKNKLKPGDTVTMQVYRDWSTNNYTNGKYVEITVTLGEMKN
jgi:serine protease Do